MAGAVFGEVGLSLFVAGTTVPGIVIDCRRQTVVFFQIRLQDGQVRSPKRRVRDEDFIVGVSSD